MNNFYSGIVSSYHQKTHLLRKLHLSQNTVKIVPDEIIEELYFSIIPKILRQEVIFIVDFVSYVKSSQFIDDSDAKLFDRVGEVERIPARLIEPIRFTSLTENRRSRLAKL